MLKKNKMPEQANKQEHSVSIPDDAVASTRKLRVAVVGGGFAGARAHFVLSGRKDIDVTVYDSKAYREYTPSILRALVHPDYGESIVLDTKERTDWEVADVQSVERNALVLASGERRPFDYCIVSSGSSYDTPIKSKCTTKAERLSEIEMWSERLDQAKTVTVVGGGYVGVELAAEIVGKWPTGKKCVLITSRETLLTGCPKKVQDYCEKWLSARGVELIFNERVTMPENSGDPHIKKSITLSDGRNIETDMAMKCVGFSPNNGVLNSEEFPGAFIEGKLHVDDRLRVISSECVYAVGDVAIIQGETCDKTVLPATRSADAAANNILRAIDKSRGCFSKHEKVYPSMRLPNLLVVSLYKNDGVFMFDDWLVITGERAARNKRVVEYFGIKTMGGSYFAIKFMNVIQYVNIKLANAGHMVAGWFRKDSS